MATKTLGKLTGQYIRWEASPSYSRDVETIDATGGALVAGTVLGRVTASGKLIAHDTAAADGSQAAVAILYEGIDAVEESRTVTARVSEVVGDDLTYHDAATTNEKTAINDALKALGVVVR